MRSIGGLVCLILLALLCGACDSEQPLQAGAQVASLSFSGPGISGAVQNQDMSTQVFVPSYNVWDMFEDSDGDMQPDDVDGDGSADTFLWCTEVTGVASNFISPVSVPWTFTLKVSILRAGQTTPEVVTSSSSLTENPAVNLTDYDSTVQTAFANCPENGWVQGAGVCSLSVDDGGMTRTFRVRTPARKLSAVNRAVVSATGNPLTDLMPGTYGLGHGLCSLLDPGPAVVDRSTPPLEIEIGKGDTIIVEARRGGAAPPMGINIGGSQSPRLEATLLIDGIAVPVQGDTSADNVPGAGFRFTYTSR